MEKNLRELAGLVGGKVVGNGDLLIKGVAPLESASEGYITFITTHRYAGALRASAASAIIIPPDIPFEGKPLIVAENPQLAYARLLTLFTSKPFQAKGIDRRAHIGRNPKIGKDITIHPFAHIGDDVEIGDGAVIHPGVSIGDGCRLGEGVVIYPNATIRERCVIGKRVIIHSGVVIGSDGFGYARDGQRHYKIPQIGIVQIDDDVEVGANTAIDRGAFGKTWIMRGVKIDNLVQVAHNVVIGEDCIIVAQAGIAGSSRLGCNVMLGGQVAIVDHLTIGDNTMIAGQSGVTSDIPGNTVVSGTPAIPHKEWLRSSVTFPRLPEMKKQIKELGERVDELETLLKKQP